MYATEHDKFREMLAGAFETLNRRAPTTASFNNWVHHLQRKTLSQIQGALDRWVATHDQPPTPANLIELIEASEPKGHQQEAPREEIALMIPRAYLLGAKRCVDMFGEKRARAAYGDVAVNIVQKNPDAFVFEPLPGHVSSPAIRNAGRMA